MWVSGTVRSRTWINKLCEERINLEGKMALFGVGLLFQLDDSVDYRGK